MTRKTTTTATVAAPVAEQDSALTTVQAVLITDAVEAHRKGTYADAIKAIKAAMTADTRKLTALDKARAALLDTRCEVVRATAWAMTFPESHAKAGKTAGQPSQSVVATDLGYNRLTFAPYWKAAEELFAKFPELEKEAGRAITEDEREHVASFWKAEALRAKARRDAAKAKAEAPKSGPVETLGGTEDGDGESGGAGAGAKGTDVPTSVTADTAIAALAVLSKTLQAMADGTLGFTAEQADLMLEGLTAAGMAVEELKITAK
jgi:uncharacterized protein YceK